MRERERRTYFRFLTIFPPDCLHRLVSNNKFVLIFQLFFPLKLTFFQKHKGLTCPDALPSMRTAEPYGVTQVLRHFWHELGFVCRLLLSHEPAAGGPLGHREGVGRYYCPLYGRGVPYVGLWSLYFALSHMCGKVLKVVG